MFRWKRVSQTLSIQSMIQTELVLCQQVRMELKYNCAVSDIRKSAVWQVTISATIHYCEELPSDQSPFPVSQSSPLLQHISPHQRSNSVLCFHFHSRFIEMWPRMGTGGLNLWINQHCWLSSVSGGGGVGWAGAEERGSFKVIFIFVFIQVQVAVRTGDLEEVSLCQTQLCGDVLP